MSAVFSTLRSDRTLNKKPSVCWCWLWSNCDNKTCLQLSAGFLPGIGGLLTMSSLCQKKCSCCLSRIITNAKPFVFSFQILRFLILLATICLYKNFEKLFKPHKTLHLISTQIQLYGCSLWCVREVGGSLHSHFAHTTPTTWAHFYAFFLSFIF